MRAIKLLPSLLLFLLVINGYSQVSNPNTTWRAGAYVGWSSSNNIDFKINSTQVMQIEPGGDVGIGTATPSERLTVTGGNIDADNTLASYMINGQR